MYISSVSNSHCQFDIWVYEFVFGSFWSVNNNKKIMNKICILKLLAENLWRLLNRHFGYKIWLAVCIHYSECSTRVSSYSRVNPKSCSDMILTVNLWWHFKPEEQFTLLIWKFYSIIQNIIVRHSMFLASWHSKCAFTISKIICFLIKP